MYSFSFCAWNIHSMSALLNLNNSPAALFRIREKCKYLLLDKWPDRLYNIVYLCFTSWDIKTRFYFISSKIIFSLSLCRTYDPAVHITGTAFVSYLEQQMSLTRPHLCPVPLSCNVSETYCHHLSFKSFDLIIQNLWPDVSETLCHHFSIKLFDLII